MKIMVELDTGEVATPIKVADAIIRSYMDVPYCRTESDAFKAHEELAEVAEHIQVYLSHNRPTGYITRYYTDGMERNEIGELEV